MLSWEDADTSCKAKGADLVSILSYAEQEEVFSELFSGPNCPNGFFVDGGICFKVSFFSNHLFQSAVKRGLTLIAIKTSHSS